MSFKALNWAYAQPIRDPVAKAVLVALANHLNQRTGRLDPSVEMLAADTGASTRTVIRKLELLESGGFIASKRHRRAPKTYVSMCQSGVSYADQEVPTGHLSAFKK